MVKTRLAVGAAVLIGIVSLVAVVSSPAPDDQSDTGSRRLAAAHSARHDAARADDDASTSRGVPPEAEQRSGRSSRRRDRRGRKTPSHTRALDAPDSQPAALTDIAESTLISPVLPGAVTPTIDFGPSSSRSCLKTARHVTSGPLRVEVRLFAEEDGTPLTDGDVAIYRQEDPFVPADLVCAGPLAVGGRAVFAHPGSGRFVVRVDAPGRVPITDSRILVPSDRSLVIEGHLRQGVVVEGKLTRIEDGAPVEGGEIRVLGNADNARLRPYFEYEIDGRVFVASDGSFRFDSVRVDRSLTLEYRSTGRATRVFDHEQPVFGDARVDEPTALSASVTGVVRTPDGSPARRATVLFVDVTDWAEWAPDRSVGARWVLESLFGQHSFDYRRALPVFTDARGRFATGELRDGATYDVLALSEEYGCSALLQDVRPTAKTSLALAPLDLRAFGRVELDVVDDNGQPLDVRTCRTAAMRRHNCENDERGQVVIARADPVAIRGIVESADGRSAYFSVEVQSGQTVRQRLVLSRGVACNGRVFDAEGRPAVGARVWIHGDGGRDSRVTTDAEGRFAAVGLTPGPYKAWIDHEGHTELRNESFAVPGPERRFDLRVGVTILATFVAPEGAALPMFASSYYEWPSDHDGHYIWTFGTIHRIKPDGGVEARGLPALGGRVGIEVPPYRAIVIDAPPADGDVIRLGEVVLQPAYRLRLLVRDESGDPVEDADVRIFSRPPFSIDVVGGESVTGPDGVLVARAAARRLDIIRVSAVGYLPMSTFAHFDDAPSKDIVVTLRQGVEIRGVAVDAEGRPVPGAAVMIRPSTRGVASPHDPIGFSQVVEADDDGRFSIRLEPGPHEIPAGTWWGSANTHEIDVREGDLLEVRVYTDE